LFALVGALGKTRAQARASIKPAMKPATAAIRANLTIRPISLRTTKTITATISAMTNSSVRMKRT